MESHPRQPKGIRRKYLQCPFTWGIPVLPDEILTHGNDSMLLSGDIWAMVLHKLYIAYQYVMREDLKRSQKLLAECYMPLLEVGGFYRCDSDLFAEYRTALKHVIDSSWAFVCCKIFPVKEVEMFLQSIIPYDCMTVRQKSAIWGIRSRLALCEDGLRSAGIAISLNPGEGQWHLYKALLLQEYQPETRVAMIEELKAFKTAYILRASPESTIFYAVSLIVSSYMLHRSSNFKKGFHLLRDSLLQWPNNPFVNFKCGVSFHKNITKPEDIYLAERCLRNTLRLLEPKKCQIAYHELGAFLLTFKDVAEGKMYLQMAKAVKHD